MKRRQSFLTLLTTLVILTQLAQPLGMGRGAAAASSGQGRPLPAKPDQSGAPARTAWTRPTLAAPSPQPVLVPPTDLGLPAIPAGIDPAFGIGNDNFGQPYNDIGNPEDHPGRHMAGPVNLINGNLHFAVGDSFFPAQGLSVQFARSYNSGDVISGTLGLGWTHSYNTAVIQGASVPVISGTTATIRNGDGSQHTYTYNGSVWLPPKGYFHSLVHSAAPDPWVRTHKNGVVETCNPQGRLETISDRNGNTLTLNYLSGDRLFQVLDASNDRSLIIDYSGTHISSVTDPLFRTTTYGYTNGRLTSVNYPEGTQATYQYDGSGRLIAVDDPHLAPEFGPTAFGYDGSNRTSVITDAVGSTTSFIYNPPQTVWTHSGGTQSFVVYDDLANIIQEAVIVNAIARIDQWLYFPTTVIAAQRTDANGRVTNMYAITRGNITQVTSPSGAVTRFRYDTTYNNVISSTNSAGHTTLYDYDVRGNLSHEYRPSGEVITYTVAISGNLLGVDNAAGSTTYQYDGFGNLTTVTTPGGHTTTNEYDAGGRPITTTDPSGYSTVYEYDASDRLVRVTDPLGGMLEYEYDDYSNLVGLTDQNGHDLVQTYDAANRLTGVTDHAGNSTSYVWDEGGRLTLRTDADGYTTTFSYDGANRLTDRVYSDGRHDRFVYDNGGRLIAHGDGTITTTIQYDPGSQPFTMTLTSPTFSGPVRVEYQYDALGNRTQTRLIDSTGDTWDTFYEYDAAGRLVQTTDNEGRLWTTTYDAAGRRSTRTLPDGALEQYFYDSRSNLVTLNHYDSELELVRSYTYQYDARGLTNESDGTQSATYQYDALSRLIQATTSQGPITYAYSPGGMRTSVNGPDGLSTTYGYDAVGHLTSTNDRTYVYDAMGRRLSSTGPDGNSIFAYDGELRLISANTPGGALQFEYDPLGRLIHRNGGQVPQGYFLHGMRGLEAELTQAGAFSRTHTIDVEIVALNLVSVNPIQVADLHYDGRGAVRWVTDGNGNTIAEYGADPSGGLEPFYNPIRQAGSYFFPELNLYLIGDGLFWDPVVGVFLCRFWPWSFWPFGPWSPWRPIFRFWPWPWIWPRPWGWAWPRPWAFLWPWPGAWVRPWVIWPLWPWPTQPWWPWWWWWQWWWWPWWGHWWHWGWWFWWHGWWWWPWWGGWWWWHWWWWPWWWWWPCWWLWWVWWWPWWWAWWWHWWWWPWWWGWGWWWWWWPWWWWGWWWWGWWWWWPIAPRPPDYGDAPDPTYPSLRANNGARHLNPDYEWLGPDRSREYNARLTNADTFDDGVTVNLAAGTATFTVSTLGYFWRYSAANPLHVHGWIDWNADGDWADLGEMVVNWSGYPGTGGWPALAASHTVTIDLTVPAGAVVPTWARFRLDYDQNVETVTGPAWYGEVEDHVVVQPKLYLPLVTR